MPSGVHTGEGKKCPPGCTCGRHRRKKRPGTGEAIRKGLLKHYKEQGPTPPPPEKWCPHCKLWKTVPENFYAKTEHRQSFDRTTYDYLCKDCRKQYNQEWRDAKTPAQKKAMHERYRRNQFEKHGEEEMRTREAERRGMKREKEGKPPSKRARRRGDADVMVPREPLKKFLEGIMKREGRTRDSLVRGSSISGARFRAVFTGRETTKKNKKGYTVVKWISVGMVDEILTHLDLHAQLTILYPPEVIDAARKAQAKETAEKAARAKAKRSRKAKERRARKKAEKERGSASSAETETEPHARATQSS